MQYFCTINAIVYLVQMLMFYSVQKTNFIFVGKNEIYNVSQNFGQII
jgi:hypothetical protein